MHVYFHCLEPVAPGINIQYLAKTTLVLNLTLNGHKILLAFLNSGSQNTALHLAAKEGHAAAVKLLMERGAAFLLNNSNASFLHEAVHHGKKEVADAVIEDER